MTQRSVPIVARIRRGATSTEFALLLTFVAIATVAAICFPGFETQESLGRFVAGWAPDSAASADERGPNPVHADTVGERAWRTKVAAAPELLAIAAAIVLNLLLWVMLFRRHERTKRKMLEMQGLEDRMPAVSQDVIFEKRQQTLKTLGRHLDELFDCRLEVRHLMSRRAASVEPDADDSEVIDLMRENGFRHLPVTEADSTLVGIISNRDIRWCGEKTAREVMTPNPLTVESTSLVGLAITMFLKERISCLPVVEEGKLCGVLTTTDLLMAFQCSLQLMRKAASGGTLHAASETSSQRISELIPA